MWIFAHRGAPAERRSENTIRAFRAALAQGAQLESDARLSRDGVVVLVHDAWVRHRFLYRRVSRLRYQDLRRRGVATAAGLYAVLGTEFELSVDLKVHAASGPLIDEAAAHGAERRLWLVSDDLEVLRRIRDDNSRVRLVHESRLRRIDDPQRHAVQLAEAGIDAQNTNTADWNRQLVDHVHATGVLAFGSLINDPERLSRARALGLDAIYTDHIGLAAEPIPQ